MDQPRPGLSDRAPSTLYYTVAQIVGTLVMTLASLYWVAVDHPDWLPATLLAAVPLPQLSGQRRIGHWSQSGRLAAGRSTNGAASGRRDRQSPAENHPAAAPERR